MKNKQTKPHNNLPVFQTRPDYKHITAARSYFFTAKRKELMTTSLNCGNNEYGYTFFATYKHIGKRLAAVITPGIMTKEESGDTFEFGAITNLTSMIWLT